MTFIENTYDKETFSNLENIGQKIFEKEFNNCTFKKCDFSQTDFSKTTFNDCKFLNCNLSNIKLTNSGFQNIYFEKTKLVGVDFSVVNSFSLNLSFKNCLINLCSFNGLDLQNTKFIDSTITDSDFVDTNLAKSDFSNSILKGTKFINADLSNTNFITSIGYYIDPTKNKIKKAQFSQTEVLNLLAGFEIEIF